MGQLKHAPMAGEYDTFYLNSEFVFAKSFMMYDEQGGSIMTFGYNTLDDLCDVYGIESDDEFYLEVDSLDKGMSAIDKQTGAIVTRIR